MFDNQTRNTDILIKKWKNLIHKEIAIYKLKKFLPNTLPFKHVFQLDKYLLNNQ